MGLEKDLERLIECKKIEQCDLCHHRMKFLGGGKYQCTFCGAEVLDNFGKLKQFLDKHGPTPSGIISQKTGLSIEQIDAFLKKGMVEIQDGEKYYLLCEKCGCDIRYGRYCPSCARQEVFADVRVDYQAVGEKPKEKKYEVEGKMHYLNRKEKEKKSSSLSRKGRKRLEEKDSGISGFKSKGDR